MGKKLTQETVLARFRETHGDRYDYSQVEYVHSQAKVVIICPEHGPFPQGPAEHARGQGCPRCARRRQTGAPPLAWDEIEERLLTVHGGKYAYDGTGYRDTTSKIRATCPLHGDFWPEVNAHLRGKYGCRECSYVERGQAKQMKFEEFLQRAREKFGYRLQYDPWSWDTHTNIGLKRLRLRCPEHGWQELKPVNHLNSPLGCPACGNLLAGDKRRLTTEEFIARSVVVHEGKYGYQKTVYTNAADKLVITCPEHGDFSQAAANHMAGHGCPACAPGGFDPDLPAIVYYIRIDTLDGVFYKIGITNLSVRKRYPDSSDWARITILREWSYEVGAEAAAHEKRVLKEHLDSRYSGPRVLSRVGVTEVFNCDVLELDGSTRPRPAQLSIFDGRASL